MKNKYWIIIILILIGFAIYFFFGNANQSTPKTADYTANRTEASSNTNENNANPDNSNGNNTTPDNANTDNTNTENANTDNANENNTNQDNVDNNSSNQATENANNADNVPTPPPVETQIATFTTKIYSNDSSRQNNIRITCSTLNDTLVENGATFSFCNTVGQSTTAKGYQKADVFDAQRK